LSQIDKSAAGGLVSQRNLQSTEYDAGRELSNILTHGIEADRLIDNIGVAKLKDGIFFVGENPDFENQLVFDLEYFTGFQNSSPADVLCTFQKTCRVALKYWEKIPFSSREWFVADKDLIVLIPKKISIGDGAKVLIDVKPDWARQEKRNTHHLLAIHYGTEPKSDQSSTTHFRRALDQTKGIDVDRSFSSEEDAPLLVDKLEEEFKPIDSNTSFASWKSLLTSNQSGFVFRDNHGPERIEGAAGTGKTLSLALRCCNVLDTAKAKKESLNVAFLTHSYASKEYIESIIFPKISWYDEPSSRFNINLTTVTLQEWCVASLGNKIEETELLDKDAQNSKEYQQILISDALEDFISNRLTSHAKFISQELLDFLSKSDDQLKVQSLQYEIAEIIKGLSGQDLSKYKKTSHIAHAIPLKSDADFECVFGLYTDYQKKLVSAGYFDSDDVVLSALGQLDSPIWRRRKNTEGFDILFIDETHLFNLNELSIIHHLLKDEHISNIIYSVDRSQSLANISLETAQIDEVFGNNDNTKVDLKTIFRSSSDIVRLAFSILSSGTTLFTNMENPLDRVEDAFTSQEEKRSQKPYCLEYESDGEVIAGAFLAADRLAMETSSKKSRIIIIATTESVLISLERYASDNNKPAKFIKRRADKKAQAEAEKGNKYILSGIDYVGGLEFDGVVIVGADKGHMPATEENLVDSRHFLNHASYNRMYVAITRAKFGVAILYSSARGLSKILEFPIQEKAIFIADN
jgi:superfamily I DNA/RNA helicase